jgi:hypothetical protein
MSKDELINKLVITNNRIRDLESEIALDLPNAPDDESRKVRLDEIRENLSNFFELRAILENDLADVCMERFYGYN